MVVFIMPVKGTGCLSCKPHLHLKKLYWLPQLQFEALFFAVVNGLGLYSLSSFSIWRFQLMIIKPQNHIHLVIACCTKGTLTTSCMMVTYAGQ